MKIIKMLGMIGCLMLLGGVVLFLVKIPTASNKVNVDLLVSNGIVVTMNQDKEIINNGAIAIQAEKIIDVGLTSQLAQKYRAKKKLNVHGSVIMPGLINAHTHSPMSLLRGYADDYPLMEWLENHIFPVEKKHANVYFVYWGTKLACYEMIQGGTTTFVDMYFFQDEVAQAAYDMGMRAVVGQTIIGFPAPDFSTYKESLSYTRDFVKKWKGNSLISPIIAPHAPYTCSKEILLEAKKFSEEHDVSFLIHVSETKDEVEKIEAKHKMRPVEYLDTLGIVNNKLIAVHCVHLSDREIDLFQKKQAGVIHVPTSNMKLSSGISRVYDMLEQGVTVGLGTDGAASNNSLDMFAEMKTAALLQKVVTNKPTALNAYQALELATIGGARAIHLDDQIGSLEVGKKADVTIVKMDQVHQIPVYNVVSQLVYATKASDVQTVIINGNIVMKDRVIGASSQYNELKRKVDDFKKSIQ